MKRLKLTKAIVISLIFTSVFALNSIVANAEWKQNSRGWWNSKGSSWSVGWEQINGKWYYFNFDGYMEHDKIIDGYKLGSDGAWITDTSSEANDSDFEFDVNNCIITKYVGTATSLSIPSTIKGASVKTIGSLAFCDNSSLENVTIPDTVLSIDSSAFTRCDKLSSISIPNSVTYIGDYAFGGCYSLTKIVIPNSVESMGDYVFNGCNNLTDITIPNNSTRTQRTLEGLNGAVNIQFN